MNIPILIICYNNYKYVKNTLEQILKINKEYYKNIQIVNNNSNCKDTINFLKNVDVNVIHNDNNGPWINNEINIHIYETLPDKYILTDPDLELNQHIPTNFIEVLSELSDKYGTSKIGLALDISDFEKMYETTYHRDQTIYNWEKEFWKNKINDSDYELYTAGVDTTFCLINKKHIYNFDNVIRVAGNFTSKHLPWYKENKIYNIYENYILNSKTPEFSTISKLIIPYLDEKYLKINKNNELFFIENNENNPNLSFWKNTYSNWENDTFKVFDKFLMKDKIFIDIGGWIATSAMYGSRKSKHVYSIEADYKAFEDMKLNLQTNCTNNYTLINKAIYNIDNMKIKFGKNKFMRNSKMNDSTSQIYEENETSDEYYLAETITLENLIKEYEINHNEIGLIKLDIEGGEENILNELLNIHNEYNIPIHISFHYNWWNNKNLDRFVSLTSEQKDTIIAYPFTSILFE